MDHKDMPEMGVAVRAALNAAQSVLIDLSGNLLIVEYFKQSCEKGRYGWQYSDDCGRRCQRWRQE